MKGSRFKHVLFTPWVGDKYHENTNIFGKRTLVLGGSHYDKDHERVNSNPEILSTWANNTLEIIECYLDDGIQDRWKKTYSNFINSVCGHSTTSQERKAFFESCAFYNYLQILAGEGPNNAGDYDYKAPMHFKAFVEVIDELKPEVIIAWGAKVWNALPDNWGFGAAVDMGNSIGDTLLPKKVYDYPYRNSTIRLVGIRHPSVGYSPKTHHQLFRQLGLLTSFE